MGMLYLFILNYFFLWPCHFYFIDLEGLLDHVRPRFGTVIRAELVRMLRLYIWFSKAVELILSTVIWEAMEKGSLFFLLLVDIFI